MNPAQNIAGERFGRLLVIAAVVVNQRTKWRCRCDCGGEKVCCLGDLRRGFVASCGCLLQESRSRNGRANHKHGLTHTPIWRMWQSMIRRCTEPTDPSYPHYGGRGITICPRWRTDFAAFIADMGQRPPGTTIERVDNDRGYEPANCVWADMTTQANNKRSNRRFTHDGRTFTVSQWAREVGLKEATVFGRLKRGWTFAQAISEPLKKNGAGTCRLEKT